MKAKNLLILIVLGLLLGAGAYLTSRPGRTEAPSDVGRTLFNDLPVNDVTRLVISSSSETVTVAKTGDTWSVPTAYGYPADFNKVRSALRKLSEIKIQESLRMDAGQMADLHLANPSPGVSNAALRVALYGAQGKEIASVLLGKHHERKAPEGPMSFGNFPDGRYLSLDRSQALLVGDPLDDFSTENRNWLEMDLLNVPGDEITDVTVAGTNGAPVHLMRDPKTDQLAIEGLAADQEMDSGKASSAAGALSYLSLSGVADPALASDKTGLNHPVVYTAKRKDGRIYTVRIGDATTDGKRYARLSVDFQAPPAPPPAAPDKKTEEKKGAETQKKDEPQKDARALNEKFQKWTYLVDSYRLDPMLVSRTDLIKKKETKPEASTNTAATATAAAPSPAVSTPAAPQANGGIEVKPAP